jgi:hypothetical protein
LSVREPALPGDNRKHRLLRRLFSVTPSGVAAGIALGLAALGASLLGARFPAGFGIWSDAGGVLVSLAGAFGGPAGGLCAGLLEGAAYDPALNLPVQAAAGLLWGLMYRAMLPWPKIPRLAGWAGGIAGVYFGLLVPFYAAASPGGGPFTDMYMGMAGAVLQECADTAVITTAVLALVPGSWTGEKAEGG